MSNYIIFFLFVFSNQRWKVSNHNYGHFSGLFTLLKLYFQSKIIFICHLPKSSRRYSSNITETSSWKTENRTDQVNDLIWHPFSDFQDCKWLVDAWLLLSIILKNCTLNACWLIWSFWFLRKPMLKLWAEDFQLHPSVDSQFSFE